MHANPCGHATLACRCGRPDRIMLQILEMVTERVGRFSLSNGYSSRPLVVALDNWNFIAYAKRSIFTGWCSERYRGMGLPLWSIDRQTCLLSTLFEAVCQWLNCFFCAPTAGAGGTAPASLAWSGLSMKASAATVHLA